MTLSIILAFAAFMISLLGTRLTILALRKRTVLVDIPNLRSNHRKPTPKGGGIPVMFALVICLLIADIDYGMVLSIFLLMAISLLDDLIDVAPLVRLMVQVMAVTVPLSIMQTPLFAGLLPVWLDKSATALLWIWFINLFNFMDGIDGISAAEMTTIGMGLAICVVIAGAFPNTLSTYGLITVGTAAGFFWWNRHPAKIFLGDVGSIPLGFLLGYFLILAAHAGYGAAALILPAYYISDSTLTILKRLIQGKKIWQAHSEHYYQQAVRAGRSHEAVVRIIFGINMLLIFLATRSIIQPNMAMFHVAMAYLTVLILLGFFSHTGKKRA